MRTGLRLVTVTTGAIALIGLGLLGCSPEQVVGNAQLPPNVADPKATETPAGAVLAYRGTLATFQTAFGTSPASVIVSGGLLADELQTASIGEPAGASDAYTPLDSRLLPEVQNPQLEVSEPYVATYGWLHAVRGQAQEARGLLINFGGDTLRPLVGRLYATEGYADIFLADLFCSGIPLSTIDFGGDYTVRPGSSTTEVYQRAVTLMDSALTVASDSARFLNFARIGKGRALLALGQYVDAAQAVAQVPDGFQYEAFYVGGSAGQTPNFAFLNYNQPTLVNYTVGDREGLTGLDYRTSGDPRTASTAVATSPYGRTLYHPNKYATDGSSPIVVADWVEARLIEAETALQAGDVVTWLGKLNHLRETAIAPTLPDTTDPGTPNARVDLLFRERAFWLFLTGHRQGDLRRLIRQYGRDPRQVFPTGPYPGGPGAYGSDVTAPIPATERLYNPQFTGCLNRGA